MTAFKLSSTEYSGSVPAKTKKILVEVIEDPPIKYGFTVNCSNSVAFGI